MVVNMRSFPLNDTILRILIDYHADVNIQNKLGYTALHLASENDNVSTVKILLESNAGVNIQDAKWIQQHYF